MSSRPLRTEKHFGRLLEALLQLIHDPTMLSPALFGIVLVENRAH
jgi:hypothetical protein